MLDSNPSLSIVIATYNGAAKLRRCLDSLLPQAEQHGLEVVVVVDGSQDNTKDVLAPFRTAFPACLRACFQPHFGPSAARNYGVAQTTEEWLLFLDDDTVLPDGFVSSVTALLEHPPADMMSFQDRPLPGDGYLPKSFRFLELASRRTLGRDLALKGAALICRRSDFDAVHGFDVNLGYYGGEDADFAERARAQQRTLTYLLEPTVLHQSPTLREYLSKSWRGIHVRASFAGRRYYRLEETVLLSAAAVGAFGTLKRYPFLRKAESFTALTFILATGTFAARLSEAPLIFVPGMILAAAFRLPFMLLGSLVYLARTCQRLLVSRPASEADSADISARSR